MKNQETLSQVIGLAEGLLKDQESRVVHCMGKNMASLVCCNTNCLEDPFLCVDKSCKCNHQHPMCPKILIQSILNPILSKIIPLKQIQQSILEQIDKTIDQLSDFRQKLSLQLKENLQFYGLTRLQTLFYYTLNKSTKQKPTGQIIFQMLKKTMNQQNSTHLNKPFENKFFESWQYVGQTIKKKQAQILQFLSSFNLEKQIEDFSLFGLSIFKGSKIILTENEQEKLITIFQPKKIDSIELLYRASQNSFKMAQFTEKCLDISDTLTICETEHGKVIGGYTPLVWRGFGAVKDKSGGSFIFSLTNNHKFVLDMEKTAIFRGADGPSFGDMNPDFSISNEGNKNDCYSRINRSYNNKNYIKCNEQSYFSFNGDPNKSYTFNTKQWEVYKINFKKT